MRDRKKPMMIVLILLAGIVSSNVLFAGQQITETKEQDALPEIGEPVSSDVLSTLSGGQSMQIDHIDAIINNMNLQSEIGQNVLHSNSTGANIVSGEAFANAGGISTVIQNSGNQVVINSALILNLRLQ